LPTALILFAHGARDPRWREPFDRLHALVSNQHDGPVVLAFLELMTPSLNDAAQAVASRGATEALVVPVFLGTGGHLRRDLPGLIEAAQQASGVRLHVAGAAGEDEHVLQAIAAYCLRSVQR
jgi:sirohydrochlorin cobaltochelatase